MAAEVTDARLHDPYAVAELSLPRALDGDRAGVSGGSFDLPTREGDIVGAGNDASVVLRDAPEGRYVVETRLTTDLGVTTVRNSQQGGIIAYVDDDNWAGLSHVAIWNPRQTEFGKKMPFAERLSFGGMLVGPPHIRPGCGWRTGSTPKTASPSSAPPPAPHRPSISARLPEIQPRP